MIFSKKSKPKRVFFDYASSTPIAPEVLKKMEPYLHGNFANPSALYSEALDAKEAVVSARAHIAEMLGAQKSEIVFTASGTESNSLALLGIFEATKKDAFVPHIITSNIEHPAILEVCKEIKRRGGEVTYIPVSEEGLISVQDVRNELKENTVLVSIAYANNEIGTIQPIREIVKAVTDFRQTHDTLFPYVHTDACQAGLYLSLHVQKLGVDMMTLDGIKMYGPRGMGMLYVRSNVTLSPILFGGGQERELRSGTENVAGIVGLAEALVIAEKMKDLESERLREIRDYGIKKILDIFPSATLNGSKDYRLPNNINICFPGLNAEFAVISLDVLGVSVSYSSSCRTLKEDSSSYVVLALGKHTCSESSLRFTFGRETTRGDIDTLVELLQKVIKV